MISKNPEVTAEQECLLPWMPRAQPRSEPERYGGSETYLLTAEAPTARLKPTCANDEVQIAYWSHRRKWEDADHILTLDQALEHVATKCIFWTWT